MNVLVVGGSGLIGGDIALYLQEQGHKVTIMSRNKPTAPPLAALDFLGGDYAADDDVSEEQLQAFDTLVFAAAADIRHLPRDGSVTPEEFYTQRNDVGVPRFFEKAKAAGIQRAVYISTFYPQVAKHRIGECAYVTSRHNTESSINAMNDESFKVCTLSPGFVWGYIDGLDVPHISDYIQFLAGKSPDIPVFAPAGGSNHITSRSIAEATLNALEKGEGGRTYLLGDENHSWQAFIQMCLAEAGRPQPVALGDGAKHPFFPDVIMFAGPGATVSYEPEAMDVLDYSRNQMRPMIQLLLDRLG